MRGAPMRATPATAAGEGMATEARSAGIVVAALLSVCGAVRPGPALAQSLLDRPPTLAGPWGSPAGVVQFNFVHRFTRGPAPERKITSFPTFLVGVGLPASTTVGFVYATNSTLAARYPNEWEFFGRAVPLRQSAGQPVDVGVQLVYNLAADGLGAEVSAARRIGPVRLLAVSRLLAADSIGGAGARGVLGAGAALRLSRHVTLAGDVASLLDRSPAAGERVAWSAGVHLAIPRTPHTLSLQVANTSATTLFAGSRGAAQTRYGFEFTIPLTLARYFGGAPRGGARVAPPPEPEASGAVTRIAIRSLAFAPGTVEITAGATIEWTNDDPLAHTVTAADSSFDSGLIEPGRKWRRTFATPGTYRYACTPHPFMRGVVVVKPRP